MPLARFPTNLCNSEEGIYLPDLVLRFDLRITGATLRALIRESEVTRK